MPAGLFAADHLDPAIWGGFRIHVLKPEVSQGPKLTKGAYPIFPNVHRTPHCLVEFNATVGVDGKVHHVLPARPGEDPVFLDAAKDAVEQWVFQPAVLNGAPVPCEVYISVPFKTVTRDKTPGRFPDTSK